MTNRIEKTFTRLKTSDEKALVGFVTAGDPTIPKSLDLIRSMCDAGLDILELGVPFSDPTADGPVIQRSSERALKNGVNLFSVLEMTKKIREGYDIPIILFSYYNPVHAYGIERFYLDSTSAGADGLLVVDLPPEESVEMTSQWTGNALSLIRLIAPTTPLERMKQIAEFSSGFLYLVSKTGITGSSGLVLDEIHRQTTMLRSVTSLPICVGFGISTAEEVASVASVADGVVVGSAFERLIEENLNSHELASIMRDRVKDYKAATQKH
jgi:tryptophan synthase alpha chain